MRTTSASRDLRRWLLGALVLAACSARPVARFPLAPKVARDGDLAPVRAKCHAEASKDDPHHVSCAPETFVSSLDWDGADQMVFRPLSRLFAVDPAGESVNVTAMDEVLDSAWFSNRIGVRDVDDAELALGACKPSDLLDPEHAAEGSWLIDHGKTDGQTPGFRATIPGKGKYLFKVDSDEGGDDAGNVVQHTERATAASVIGAAVYQAAGFNTSCEQVVYVRRSTFKLKEGLKLRTNAGFEKKFDKAALDEMLKETTKKGDLLRLSASAWLPGHLVGPFHYSGTRSDDPNDVVAHEDRRELRGSRLLAAWISHTDAREQNTMDSWIVPKGAPEDSSPGFLRHYILDTSDCFGSEWQWDALARRFGLSYILDWGDIGQDFITLGIPTRPWDRIHRSREHIKFGFYEAEVFQPDKWKNEYPNPAFTRMSERDGAWMSRILARFTPGHVHTLATMGKFTDPRDTVFLEQTMEARLEKILNRYLTRLSPIANASVDGDALCGVDLLEYRGLREPSLFHYTAESADGSALEVRRSSGGRVCVPLPHAAPDGGVPDDDPGRYRTVTVRDGVARGHLVAYLYDLGPSRGYRLAGLVRPEP